MKREELNEILTVKDIKNYLRIGTNQAYELVYREKFKSFRIGKTGIRIHRDSFLEWLDSETLVDY
ncbi:helix-turn-helix domain-containing protein [Clostridium sp.]|uniref:helix-turn-helix domain-containing protein n=1 Tax=Clostridium sp. TaxID=1506 RepID=UPI003995ECFD